MSSKSKKNQPARRLRMLEESRQGLAEERDRAINEVTALKQQMMALVQQHQQMRNDMVRWVTAFMLLNEKQSMVVPEAFLAKTNDWVLTRENNAEDRTIAWALITKDEALAQQEAQRKAQVEAAERAQVESQDETPES